MVLVSICTRVPRTIPTSTASNDPLSSKENRRESTADVVVSNYFKIVGLHGISLFSCKYFISECYSEQMNYRYKTCLLSPKGMHVSGDDQSSKLSELLEEKSNELGKKGWRIVSVTPTLNSGGSATKLLLTFMQEITEDE